MAYVMAYAMNNDEMDEAMDLARRLADDPVTPNLKPSDAKRLRDLVDMMARTIHAYPVSTQRRRAPERQAPCRTNGYVSESAS